MLFCRLPSVGRGGLWVCVVLALAMQGCGGGGSGTGSERLPDRGAPLALGSDNFKPVADAGLRDIEAILKLAQHASTEVRFMARSGVTTLETRCAAEFSSAVYTLVDADGDGKPSGGDSLNVVYKACQRDYLGSQFDGTLTIRLTAVADAQQGAMTGLMDFGAGLKSSDNSQGTWFGSLEFRRSLTMVQEQLEVSTLKVDNLSRTFDLPNDNIKGERREDYQRARFVRTLQRDTARASLSGSMSLASERLGGRVEVALDPQLSGYLDTHADSGSLRVTGAANSRIRLPATATGGGNVVAELDSDDDGVADATLPLKWNQLFEGYLWSEQNHASLGFLFERDDTRLRLLSVPESNPAANVSVSAPLQLQFDRPLRATTSLKAQLVDHGSSTLDTVTGIDGDALSDVWPVVETTVDLSGAVVTIVPREPLRYGHTYQLLLFDLQSDGQFGVTLHDSTGHLDLNVNTQLAFFQTDDLLWVGVSGAGNRSLVMPDQPAQVAALTPQASALALKYQWTQLSGPTLVFGSPTASTSQVSLGAGMAPGTDVAKLQVTVTDAVGRKSITPFELQLANLQGVDSSMYFRRAKHESIVAEQTRVYTEQTGHFLPYVTSDFLAVRFYGDDPGRTLIELMLVAPGGRGVPKVGSYTDLSYPSDLESVAPKLSFGGGCFRIEGNFQVLEIQAPEVHGDEQATVQQLAVDFELTCLETNQPTPIHGSVRIHSGLPIKP